MKKIFFTTLLLGALIAILPIAQAATPPFIPEHGKLLIVGQQKDTLDDYLKDIGVVPGGFMFYTSIQNMDGLDKPANHDAGINFAQYYINRYPNTVIQLGIYMVGALDETLKGSYDRNIIKLAGWLKSINRPVYLRIGYEFDLPDNNYEPHQYQQAYRYIVDHLRSLGVKNVAYVWHSACMVEPLGNFMDWYPGDDYVDWFGVSIFNAMQISTAKNFSTYAFTHKKPMLIAESSPAGEFSMRSKMEWFKHYFDFINEEDIKVVCYINSNWNTYPLFKTQNWGDAKVQDDPQIEDRWVKQTKDFLHSSPDLFDGLTGRYNDFPSSSSHSNAFSAE